MKIKRAWLGVWTASCLLAVSLPVQSLAASPSFARTAEEWAALQDNNLDYGEIAGLVHEYNPTVQQNQYDYEEFRNKYGVKKEDVSSEYQKLADELRNDIEYPDSDSANYAVGMAAAVAAEAQAKSLEKKADDNLEDAEIRHLTYEQAEKTLVQTAENNMISYESGLLDIENSNLAKSLSEVNLAAAQGKLAAGSGTQLEVLTAQQNELNAEQAIIKTQSTVDTTKRKLQIMLGWSGDAAPNIGEVPAPDMDAINAMNPAADKDKAIENNYALRINLKKLQNATSDTQKNTLNSQIADNKVKIAASLNNAFANVKSALDNYTYTEAQSQLKAQQLAQSAQKYAVGTASKLEYDTATISSQQADLAFRQAAFNLRQAQEAYTWAVNGLASVS